MARDRAARPEARPRRLFVAVEIPDDVRDAVAETVERLRPGIPDARWTRPEGWHVTLKFLGPTWPRLVPAVEDAVARAAAGVPPFDVEVGSFGAFPTARRARVLWVGLDDPAGSLAASAATLDRLLEADFRTEKRPFAPHLTVARLDAPRDIGAVVGDGGDAPALGFRVEELVLFESHLSPRGATYEAVLRAPLSAPR